MELGGLMSGTMLQGRVTNSWTFDFEEDLDPYGYRLPNGVRVGLPSRGGAMAETKDYCDILLTRE